jgi:acetyltransferase EpsM
MNLYGASGHCKVVIEAIQASSKATIETIFDDNPKVESIFDIPVKKPTVNELSTVNELVITIGNNQIRKKISQEIAANYSKVIHPKAIIATNCHIGNGTVVFAGAIVNPDATIGEHCIINSGAIVEHDCKLENFVHISPNASLAGNVSVGEGTHIGIGATVIQGIKIGKWVTIGAGAVVIRDVEDNAVMVGNPAKKIKNV